MCFGIKCTVRNPFVFLPSPAWGIISNFTRNRFSCDILSQFGLVCRDYTLSMFVCGYVFLSPGSGCWLADCDWLPCLRCSWPIIDSGNSWLHQAETGCKCVHVMVTGFFTLPGQSSSVIRDTWHRAVIWFTFPIASVFLPRPVAHSVFSCFC